MWTDLNQAIRFEYVEKNSVNFENKAFDHRETKHPWTNITYKLYNILSWRKVQTINFLLVKIQDESPLYIKSIFHSRVALKLRPFHCLKIKFKISIQIFVFLHFSLDQIIFLSLISGLLCEHF